MVQGIENTVANMLTPLLDIEGFELVAVETAGSNRYKILRLLIHKPGGLSISDCQTVNQAVLPVLEVHKIMSKYKQLEIASPGLDRPLITAADFRRNNGRTVKVEVESQNKKTLEVIGKVIDVEDSCIIIEQASGKTVNIELSRICKGYIQLAW